MSQLWLMTVPRFASVKTPPTPAVGSAGRRETFFAVARGWWTMKTSSPVAGNDVRITAGATPSPPAGVAISAIE